MEQPAIGMNWCIDAPNPHKKTQQRIKRVEKRLDAIDAKLHQLIEMINALPPVQSQHYANTMKLTLTTRSPDK
jgi:hypothetical protein